MLRLTLCVLAFQSTLAAAELPADLAVIPGDAAGFISIDVKALVSTPPFDEARLIFAGLRANELETFAKRFPIDPTTLQRVIIILPGAETLADPIPSPHPTATSAVAVVTLSKAFNPDVLLRSFFDSGRTKSYRGRSYQFDEDSWSGVYALPDNRTFVLGAEDSIIALLEREGKDVPGPLSAARSESVGHHLFVAINPPTALPNKANIPANLVPLTAAQRVTMAIDLPKSLKIDFRMHFSDAQKAEAGEIAFRDLAGLGRMALGTVEEKMKQMADGESSSRVSVAEIPNRFAMLLGVGLVRRLDRVLETLPLQRNGSMVSLAFDCESSNMLMAVVTGITAITALGSNASATFTSVGSTIKPNAGPTPQEVRLKKLYVALEGYRAANGSYPPAAVKGKDNTPLLSWRVALLPYLGEQKLYDQFKLDEPWDSLHNKRLIAKMPQVLNKSQASPTRIGKTNTELFPAGASLLALEAGGGWDSVYWTKPSELTTVPSPRTQAVGKLLVSPSWVLAADGSTKYLDKKLIEQALPTR